MGCASPAILTGSTRTSSVHVPDRTRVVVHCPFHATSQTPVPFGKGFSLCLSLHASAATIPFGLRDVHLLAYLFSWCWMKRFVRYALYMHAPPSWQSRTKADIVGFELYVKCWYYHFPLSSHGWQSPPSWNKSLSRIVPSASLVTPPK